MSMSARSISAAARCAGSLPTVGPRAVPEPVSTSAAATARADDEGVNRGEARQRTERVGQDAAGLVDGNILQDLQAALQHAVAHRADDDIADAPVIDARNLLRRYGGHGRVLPLVRVSEAESRAGEKVWPRRRGQGFPAAVWDL